MWRDTARDFLDIPILMFPLHAPLSRPMVEHLVLLECQQYRRAVISSWPEREEIWQRVLERVQKARADVCEFMDVFVLDDIKKASEEGIERSFPDSVWLLEQLAVYSPGNKNSQKGLEEWQARNILRRENPGSSRWKLDDVASVLIMRLVNTTHQRGWLPAEISPDEPRWWCFGKNAPDAPTQSIPIPLQGGEDTPLFLWTPRIGASWQGDWQRLSGVSVRWSRSFARAGEVEVWHNVYGQEIKQAARHAVELSTKALQLSQESTLLSYKEVQTTLQTATREAIERVQVAMLRKAEQLILEKQATLLSKEK